MLSKQLGGYVNNPIENLQVADNEVLVGPFAAEQIEVFEGLLNSQKVQFEMKVQPNEMGAQVAFFKVLRAEMERLAPELEKLGLFSNSTGEDELGAEDYLCVTCDYHAHNPGNCPKCKTELVDFSTYNSRMKEHKMKSDKTGVIFALIVAAVVAAVMYFKN
jgi:hypothetical protein